jgi:hypothetical protein
MVSKPGDGYPTADAAAIDALIAVDDLTLSTKLEYAGRIYQKVDGSFSYTRGLNDSQRDPSIPNRNCCPDFSTPGEVPKGTVSMGSYHTHPYTRGTTNAEFSMLDLSFYTYKDKLPGYLLGTNDQGVGVILKFTPGETVTQGITQILGTISNGSFVPNPAYDPNRKPHVVPPGGDSYDPDHDDRPDDNPRKQELR